MKYVSILVFSAFIFSSSVVQAQRYTVPSEYTFSEPGEYKTYETSIIEAVNWIEITGLDQEEEKRTKANRFIIEWLTGSPDVTIEINEKIVVFTEKNPELLTAFMGGWARLIIKDSSRASDKLGCNLAGLICAMNVYQIRGRKKDKEMEKLLKLMKKNELSAWVKKQLAD